MCPNRAVQAGWVGQPCCARPGEMALPRVDEHTGVVSPPRAHVPRITWWRAPQKQRLVPPPLAHSAHRPVADAAGKEYTRRGIVHCGWGAAMTTSAGPMGVTSGQETAALGDICRLNAYCPGADRNGRCRSTGHGERPGSAGASVGPHDQRRPAQSGGCASCALYQRR